MNIENEIAQVIFNRSHQPDDPLDLPAEAVMPLVKRAQAEALREFANSLDPYAGTVLNPESVAEMARWKANQTEKEAGA